MDAQRIQAYVKLIQTLLSNSSSQEKTILQQHQNLLDEGLLWVMAQNVETLQQLRQGDNAKRIEQIAAQLAQSIGSVSVSPSEPAMVGELQSILQALSQPIDLQGMPQRIELCKQALKLLSRQENAELWAKVQLELGNSLIQALDGNRLENIEQAISAYEQSLQVLTRDEMPIPWAQSMMNLANAYTSRIRGDRAENIEQAISAYEQSLQVLTRDEMPIPWAQSMMNLANAYTSRIRGDRAENIEQAISAYEQSLQVLTRDEMPIPWAQSMMNLANAYTSRIRGDRAENIEQAISAYEQSLQVLTRDEMPIPWAQSMMNMAYAYTVRIQGDHAENVEVAISSCEGALQVITRESMPIEWANSMNSLAIAYADRIKGNRAENIETAIEAYMQSLRVRTFKTMPVEWAQSMMNLAIAYADRIYGSREENIEKAIEAHEQSLQVRTRDAMPVQWAISMMNLAFAYTQRIKQDRARNIEKAIDIYEQSLQVTTYEAMPVQWAISMMNLANAYQRRIKGSFSDNIEAAIKCCEQALQVFTRETMPAEWAASMESLALAYSDRIKGDRAGNIEQAIHAHGQSLQVLTRETRPIRWAQAMTNLANAYQNRVLGDRAENIEKAIATYRQALEVRLREALPTEWAQATSNLASAYTYRIKGDHAENIEKAIATYKQSLQVTTREALPIEWAQGMNNLATAYANRVQGDRAENIENAINNYRQSLEVMTREAMPVSWAKAMMNLANAYYSHTLEDSAEDIEETIKACQQSLKIFTPEAHPNDCRRTARFLANLYADGNRWIESLDSYHTALTAVEVLYQAALSKGSQEAELSETNDLYRRAAYAYAKVGNLTAAVATLEQGRARGLSETLQRDRADIENIRRIEPDLVGRYQTAANAVNQLEATERRINTNRESRNYNEESFRQQATQARQSLKECLTEIRQISGYENFLALPTFDDVAETIQPDHTLVYLLSTPNGSLALILTTEGLSDIWLNDLTEQQLIDLLNNDWFRSYSAYRESPTNRQDWLDAIDEVTHQLWNVMMDPLISHLQQNNLSKAILIPTGYLSYLPLHAAWTSDTTKPNGRRYACDDIQFTYTPNVLSLNSARSIANQTSATTLLAINEPQPVNAGNLPSASIEAAKAISAFSGKDNWNLLQQENATRTAVLEQLPHKNVVHFSCHGFADFGTPLNSGLLMANDEILSLRDLLDLKLKTLRLAILSACETGIPGTKLPDEVISLPTGLLQAGAAGVVSSLWSVADLSTMLLLSRFYDLWRTEDLEPPEALRQAQIWLRDSDGTALAPYLASSHPELAQKLAQKPDQCPFAHPFYWAAFTYVGV